MNSKLHTCFLFLRAINVGGHNIIRMKDLTLWLEQLGYSSVKTLLNSGNVLFRTSIDETSEIEKQVREKILHESNLDIPCFVRTLNHLNNLSSILSKHEASKPPSSTVFLTLLSSLPKEETVEKLHTINTGPDTFTHYDTEIVLLCQVPYHQTKLSNTLIEKTLRCQATTRNINTIQAMLALAK